MPTPVTERQSRPQSSWMWVRSPADDNCFSNLLRSRLLKINWKVRMLWWFWWSKFYLGTVGSSPVAWKVFECLLWVWLTCELWHLWLYNTIIISLVVFSASVLVMGIDLMTSNSQFEIKSAVNHFNPNTIAHIPTRAICKISCFTSWYQNTPII